MLPPHRQLLWDLYCRVVDNFGDAGVCWRLAADLAARGQRVRLVIDDPAPLAWMAPGLTAGVQVQRWPGMPWAPGQPVPDVVVEAFGCDPPASAIGEMQRWAAAGRAPVWINLEYLSAEPWAERSHGLLSPQPAGLAKWFFFPGFTARTGGLLREADLPARQAAFDRAAWLAGLGLQPAPGERVVSLFCYENPALPALLQALSARPTLLLATAGHAQRQVGALARLQALPALSTLPALSPRLRVAALPWLSQRDFDHLLWACDLNFVRGEDSLVRAVWAGAPMVWQAYPQHDGVHAWKLQAVLDDAALPAEVATLWRVWNGLGDAASASTPAPAARLPVDLHAASLPLRLPALDATSPWRAAQQRWRARLWSQDDLATRLLAFVLGKSRSPGADPC